MSQFALNLINNNPDHEPPIGFLNQLKEILDNHEIEILRSNEDIGKLKNIEYILGWSLPTSIVKRFGSLKGFLLFSSQVPESYQSLKLEVIDSKGINAPFVVEYIKKALPPGWENKRILILGRGNIGGLLAQNLKNSELRLMTRSPSHSNEVNYSKFSEEVAKAQIIIPTLSLSRETASYFTQEAFFNFLRSDVYLINTTRGKLIPEEDLVRFFKNNPDAFYHTDVTDPEPYPKDGELNLLKNCKITNHIAGFGDEYWQELAQHIKSKIQNWL